MLRRIAMLLGYQKELRLVARRSFDQRQDAQPRNVRSLIQSAAIVYGLLPTARRRTAGAVRGGRGPSVVAVNVRTVMTHFSERRTCLASRSSRSGFCHWTASTVG